MKPGQCRVYTGVCPLKPAPFPRARACPHCPLIWWRRPTAPKERRGYLRSERSSVKQLSFAEHAERAPASTKFARSRDGCRKGFAQTTLQSTTAAIAEQRESCGEKKSGAPDSRFLPSSGSAAEEVPDSFSQGP